MAKYSKQQVQHILSRLKGNMLREYEIKSDIFKKIKPAKPKAVEVYEAKLEEAKEESRRIAAERCAGQTTYLKQVEDSLILGDSNFDLNEAIETMKKLGA